MSTIALQFVAIGDNATNGGYVDIGFNDNVNVHQLKLTSVDGPSSPLKFSAIPTGIPTDEDAAQAQAYASAFNRDFKNVGGSNNLKAVAVGDIVTITAIVGTFDTFAETGNFVTNNGIVNSVQVTPIVFAAALTGTGDCTNVEFSATASGGTAPYVLNNGVSNIVTGWDGTAETFNLPRSEPYRILKVTDDNGLEKTLQVTIPRVLKPGEFKEQSTQFIGYSDVVINSVNPVANTTPITYALVDTGDTPAGGDYQSSNAFPGVLAGTYDLYIKDKYGCAVSKTIVVYALQDATETDNPRYFEIMHPNSLIFSELPTFSKSIKPHFGNTLSFNDLSDIRYEIEQAFDPEDYIGTQFKSSYPYHVITLYGCDGSQKNIAPIMVQENLGAIEKVDCKLYPVGSKTGIYFDGGNEYTPSTTTVIGASEYTTNSPRWAIVGQIVTIDGVGAFTIESEGYDSVLGKGYYVIDTVTASTTDAKIQATYNAQQYNVFEFYLDISDISNKAKIVIEKGFSFSEIDGNPWVSEYIRNQADTEENLLIQWSSSKNRGGMVFQSGIQCLNRMPGYFRPTFEGDTEKYDGDSRMYVTKDETYQRYRLEFEWLTARQVLQLTVAAALDGFKVNGVPVRRSKFPDIEAKGVSNFYSWGCDLGYTGDLSAVQSDELVLDVSTGVVGGGGTGKPGAPLVYDGLNRLGIDGGLVLIDGKTISV